MDICKKVVQVKTIESFGSNDGNCGDNYGEGPNPSTPESNYIANK